MSQDHGIQTITPPTGWAPLKDVNSTPIGRQDADSLHSQEVFTHTIAAGDPSIWSFPFSIPSSGLYFTSTVTYALRNVTVIFGAGAGYGNGAVPELAPTVAAPANSLVLGLFAQNDGTATNTIRATAGNGFVLDAVAEPAYQSTEGEHQVVTSAASVTPAINQGSYPYAYAAYSVVVAGASSLPPVAPTPAPATAPFNPASVPGLVGRYDPSVASSVTSSNGVVSALADLSGRGTNLAQTNSAQQPLIIGNDLNGLPTLAYDQTAQKRLTINTSAVGNYGAIFVAVDHRGGNGAWVAVGGPGDGWKIGVGAQYGDFTTTGNDLIGLAEGVGFVSSTTSVPSGGNVADLTFSGSVWGTRLNGSPVNSGFANYAPQASTAFSIGGYTSADPTARYTSDRIGEVLIYGTTLSTVQVSLVEGYLACKWGTQASLPAGHPYATTCPTASSIAAGPNPVIAKGARFQNLAFQPNVPYASVASPTPTPLPTPAYAGRTLATAGRIKGDLLGAFYDSIGINTHFTYGNYANFDYLSRILEGMQIKHIRDGMNPQDYAAANRFGYLASQGITVNTVINLNETSVGIQHRLQEFPAGSLDCIESTNEPDNNPYYDSNYGADIRNLISQQIFPLEMSAGITPGCNIGTATGGGSYAPFGDLSQYVTHGNMHPYLGNQSPGSDGLSSNWLGAHIAYTSRYMMATETGYADNIQQPTGAYNGKLLEDVRSKYTQRYLEMLWDSYASDGSWIHVPRTDWYELVQHDQGRYGPDFDSSLGLIDPQGVQTQAVAALQGLIWSHYDPLPTNAATYDPIAAAQSCSLPIAITPSNGAQVNGYGAPIQARLFCASDGSYRLDLWQEVGSQDRNSGARTTPAAVSVNIALGTGAPAATGLYTFDPTVTASNGATGADKGAETYIAGAPNLAAFPVTDSVQTIVLGGLSAPSPAPALPTNPPTPVPFSQPMPPVTPAPTAKPQGAGAAAVAIVQSAYGIIYEYGNGSITLPSAPSPGNLLDTSGDVVTGGTLSGNGFTTVDFPSALPHGGGNGFLATRVVQSGDGPTFGIINSGGGGVTSEKIEELSGVDPINPLGDDQIFANQGGGTANCPAVTAPRSQSLVVARIYSNNGVNGFGDSIILPPTNISTGWVYDGPATGSSYSQFHAVVSFHRTALTNIGESVPGLSAKFSNGSGAFACQQLVFQPAPVGGYPTPTPTVAPTAAPNYAAAVAQESPAPRVYLPLNDAAGSNAPVDTIGSFGFTSSGVTYDGTKATFNGNGLINSNANWLESQSFSMAGLFATSSSSPQMLVNSSAQCEILYIANGAVYYASYPGATALPNALVSAQTNLADGKVHHVTAARYFDFAHNTKLLALSVDGQYQKKTLLSTGFCYGLSQWHFGNWTSNGAYPGGVTSGQKMPLTGTLANWEIDPGIMTPQQDAVEVATMAAAAGATPAPTPAPTASAAPLAIVQQAQSTKLSSTTAPTANDPIPVSFARAPADGNVLLTLAGGDIIVNQAVTYPGINQIQRGGGSSSDARSAFKITSGDTAAQNVGQTNEASIWMAGSMFEIAGAATTNTINASGVADVAAAGSTYTAPAMTTTVPSLLFAAWVFEDQSGITGATVSNGWTIAQTIVTGGAAGNLPIRMYVATKQQSAAGSEAPVLTIAGRPSIATNSEVTDLAIAPASTTVALAADGWPIGKPFFAKSAFAQPLCANASPSNPCSGLPADPNSAAMTANIAPNLSDIQFDQAGNADPTIVVAKASDPTYQYQCTDPYSRVGANGLPANTQCLSSSTKTGAGNGAFVHVPNGAKTTGTHSDNHFASVDTSTTVPIEYDSWVTCATSVANSTDSYPCSFPMTGAIPVAVAGFASTDGVGTGSGVTASGIALGAAVFRPEDSMADAPMQMIAAAVACARSGSYVYPAVSSDGTDAATCPGAPLTAIPQEGQIIWIDPYLLSELKSVNNSVWYGYFDTINEFGILIGDKQGGSNPQGTGFAMSHETSPAWITIANKLGVPATTQYHITPNLPADFAQHIFVLKSCYKQTLSVACA